MNKINPTFNNETIELSYVSILKGPLSEKNVQVLTNRVLCVFEHFNFIYLKFCVYVLGGYARVCVCAHARTHI